MMIGKCVGRRIYFGDCVFILFCWEFDFCMVSVCLEGMKDFLPCFSGDGEIGANYCGL